MLVVSCIYTQAQDMWCFTSLAKITFLDGASNQSPTFTYIIHMNDAYVIYIRRQFFVRSPAFFISMKLTSYIILFVISLSQIDYCFAIQTREIK